jgi:hypothetical protein
MHELIVNLHMHTTYSDGSGSHQDIANAAHKAGIDIVIITDHNVLVKGLDGYHLLDGHRVLLLVGQEVHNPSRQPQKSHLLIAGVDRDLSQYGNHPQNLIDQVKREGGISFIAHPWDLALPLFGEDDISWDDWQVQGYTGIEIWNGLSELKSVIHNRLEAAFFALFPQYVAHSPLTQTIGKWDELLSQGRQVVAVGGSDAHALNLHMGPIRRTVFPYDFHFSAINTHILTPCSISDNWQEDRRMVMEALQQGHAYVGYDLPHNTKGFRFSANGKSGDAIMGDRISLEPSVTLQIRLPITTECRLLRNGQLVKTWNDRGIATYIATQPGAYRVECYIKYLGKRRGWIFSNPIYVI